MKKAKTRLFLEVQYDPEATDPEGLASAVDRLLETALSIPDVLEEYGNPKFGEFLVLPASRDETRQEGAAASDCEGVQDYRLAIDRPLLKSQREWLVAIRESIGGAVEDGDCRIHVEAEGLGLLDGLIDLTDEISDQAGVAKLRESGDADP